MCTVLPIAARMIDRVAAVVTGAAAPIKRPSLAASAATSSGAHGRPFLVVLDACSVRLTPIAANSDATKRRFQATKCNPTRPMGVPDLA